METVSCMIVVANTSPLNRQNEARRPGYLFTPARSAGASAVPRGTLVHGALRRKWGKVGSILVASRMRLIYRGCIQERR